tara:strand:- start:9443 stop:10900 length:1458 start_codon:yes stop_codon:yes gene_type:complete
MKLYDLKLFLPETLLIISSIIILIYGIFFNKKNETFENVFYITLFFLFFSLYASLKIIDFDKAYFNNLLINNYFTVFFKTLILSGAIIIVYISYNYLKDLKILSNEFFFLINLSIVGILLLISSNNIFTMYLGLELQAICLYILAAYNKFNIKSSESGVKFFLIGALSSGILLYGLSLIYSFTNSTNFADISLILSESKVNNENFLILNLGFILILCGLFFKIAVVPFHMWAPDLYEGSPLTITAFFATIPKIGAIAFIIKFLYLPFLPFYTSWFQILYFVSVISLIYGSVVAINQFNFKRLLAYSSITHMGFILIGLLSLSNFGIKSVQLYTFVYLINIIGIFTCLTCLKNKKNGSYLENIKDLSGLLKKNSFISFSLAIFLFSLIGLPPLSGFFGKLYILIGAIENKYYFISIIAILSSIISAFYYLRIIKNIFFDNEENNLISVNINFFSKFIILMSLILTIFLIVFLSDFLDLISTTSIIK